MSNIMKGLVAEKKVSEDLRRADDLQFAHQQAKKITKQIKYDNTVRQIVTEISLLAEKYQIDKDSLETAINNVRVAQQQLEGAIYGLDEIFQDAMKQAQWGEVEEGQIYSTGGGAGQSQRKYKVKPAGLKETEAVNRNNPTGWRWTNIKPAGI